MKFHLQFSDFLILGGAVLLVLSSYIVFWAAPQKVNQLEIYVLGQKQYVLDLNEDKVIDVAARLGITRVQIEQGKVRITDSPCSTKYCVRSGWLDNAAGILACLPNGVSLRLVGGTRTYDAINF